MRAALVGTPMGRVIHEAVVGDNGEAFTTCHRVLVVGWQEFDETEYDPTCEVCNRRARARA